MNFALFIVIIQGIIFLMHYCIYKVLTVFIFSGTVSRIILGILIFILSISFVGLNFLARSYVHPLITPFIPKAYELSSIWMGLSSYLFFSAIIIALTCLLAHFMAPSSTYFMGVSSLVFFFLVSFLAQGYGLYNAREIKETRYFLQIPNLNPSWDNQDIVFMSDLHLGLIHKSNSLEKIVKKIKDIEPYAIFIAGDFFDGTPIDLASLKDGLSRLTAPGGVYFVTGNHEGYGASEDYLAALREAGIIVLDDEIVMKDDLQIIGLSYGTSLDRDSTKKTLERMQVNRDTPSILLKHVPKDLDPIIDEKITLALFGHSHNGQQLPWNFLAQIVYKGFNYGKHSVDKTTLITTSGVGTWGPPQRIGTNNEVVIINLRLK